MNSSLILGFLRRVMANNNRQWFQEHKDEYAEAKASFEQGVTQALGRIAAFDTSVAHITLKDATYRFYRDTRFSPDKSPYKNHLGAYIAAHGKKALHGGYYLHMEPDHCLLAVGNYYLPTDILTSCRNEIMANIDRWQEAVENPQFVELFGRPGEGTWDDAKGFGMNMLKKCPKDFPKDYPHMEYLRMKDYCCWHRVPDAFFGADGWLDEMERIFLAAKPMMDMMNSVIDDYE